MQISIFNRWKSNVNSFSINDLIINYTGEYTDTIITDTNSISYRLLTFTSSGELVLSHNVIGELWYCNGGNRGHATGRGGTGGSFCPATTISLDTNPIQISIGLSDQATQFGNFIPNELIQGSGGGGSGNSSSPIGSGGNVSTIPYLDELNFQPHCAGGGGGAYIQYSGGRSYKSYTGGAGGSNGSNGGSPTGGSTSTSLAQAYGGSGGNYGGGEGGKASGHSSQGRGYPGTDGSFYGAGGGGGGRGNTAGSTRYSSPGLGYQGVVYLRFPL